MKMFDPIKLAIKELDQFLFIKRVKEIYNNPGLSETTTHYELWIFTWTLALTHIFISFFINLYSDYFLFDPDRDFNLAKLTVVLVKNGATLAILISLISGLIFKILGFKNINYYIGLISLRVIYVFSLHCFILSICVALVLNNLFKHCSYMPNLYESIILILLLIFWIFLNFKLLFIPMYKIVPFGSKVISILIVTIILGISIILNHFVSKLFPVDFFLNMGEIQKIILSCHNKMLY